MHWEMNIMRVDAKKAALTNVYFPKFHLQRGKKKKKEINPFGFYFLGLKEWLWSLEGNNHLSSPSEHPTPNEVPQPNRWIVNENQGLNLALQSSPLCASPQRSVQVRPRRKLLAVLQQGCSPFSLCSQTLPGLLQSCIFLLCILSRGSRELTLPACSNCLALSCSELCSPLCSQWRLQLEKEAGLLRGRGVGSRALHKALLTSSSSPIAPRPAMFQEHYCLLEVSLLS